MLRASGRWLTWSILFGAAGCATTGAPSKRRLLAELHPLVVLSAPDDLPADEVRWVDEALPSALGRVKAYELVLRERVEMRLHSSMSSFAAATGKKAKWLRAWTDLGGVIHLLPPSTWRDPSHDAAVERLAHELTHAATFQALGGERGFKRIEPPFWFYEGVASVVAGQGPRRMPLGMVVERADGDDPLTRSSSWLKRDHFVAYGAAHHGVAALTERYGSAVVVRVIDAAAADGARGAVERALASICDVTPAELWAMTRVRATAAAELQ